MTIALLRVSKLVSSFMALLLLVALGLVLYGGVRSWNKLPAEQAILSHYEKMSRHRSHPFIRLNEIPQHVRLAVFIAEDSDYLTHGAAFGSCVWRLMKSALVNERDRHRVSAPCGDRIPVRAARDFLAAEYSIRPVWPITTVAVLVWKMEAVLSREQIVELVLNGSYFGKAAYGLSEAASAHFSKTIDQLTLAEAAVLAGLLKAPSTYSPARHPLRTRKRRDFVLSQLLSREKITELEYLSAIAQPLGGMPLSVH